MIPGPDRIESISASSIVRKVLAGIGAFVRVRAARTASLAAVSLGVLIAAMIPSNWRRTVRAVLIRQVLFTGVEALGFIGFIAILTGASVVLQVHVWLSKVGQSQLTGPFLVLVVVRELAPLLANLVVIGRSGNAIAAELGQMAVAGEVRALSAQGVDPGVYLVLPRVVGTVVSVACLAVYFAAVALVSGYGAIVLLHIRGPGALYFVNQLAAAIDGRDLANTAAKTILPALTAGVICTTEGLGIAGRAGTEVPRATTRAVQRSVAWLFAIFAFVTALTYLDGRQNPRGH